MYICNFYKCLDEPIQINGDILGFLAIFFDFWILNFQINCHPNDGYTIHIIYYVFEKIRLNWMEISTIWTIIYCLDGRQSEGKMGHFAWIQTKILDRRD